MKPASPNPASRRFRRPPWFAQLANRLMGDWPLTGATVPLGEHEFRALFRSYPAFVDYLPFADYDPDAGVFELDDGVSVGAVFRLGAADLDARAPERLAEFNAQLDHVLALLPAEDDLFPYIVQIYLENREPPDLADTLAEAAPDAVRETPLTRAWLAAARAHSALMASPRGIFDDARASQTGERSKGWRAVDQQIHCCIYRKATPAAWKHRRHTPAQRFNHAIAPFLTGLETVGVRVCRLDEEGLRRWLLPWLTPVVAGFDSPQAYLASGPLPPPEKRGAAWELAQHLLQVPPLPIPERDDERDRGVWRFGPVYTRFMTLQGLDREPKDGVLTLDRQDGNQVEACPWDLLPPETVLTWTIVPRSPLAVDRHLDELQLKIDATTSDSAGAAAAQMAVAKAARRQHEMIYNVQMGAYLRADSLAALDERTLLASTLLSRNHLYAIPAQFDLIADDSFVRNLPMVYDWGHDSRHGLRSRLTYTAHLASVLPLFGRSTGTGHACFAGWHRRDGQTFHINFYHPKDRVRVAHTVVFGPTGAGKSATVINMALSSMAVNRPWQIIVEKGNSFGLLCEYYRRHGLKVREILFNRGQDVCYPPYVETAKALAEHRGELGAEGDDDEQRSYLAEMLYMTTLMVTGGRARELDALTTSDRAVVQSALIRALEASAAAGQPHARPQDVRAALLALAGTETIPEIRLRVRQMADAMILWTEGLRGHFFDRFGAGFDGGDDVIHIDLGILTSAGNEDMLALATLSLLATITAHSEKHQASGRHTEVLFDEAHYIAKTALTAHGFVVGTKVWRKLHTWLTFATQDFSDASDLAKQILSQAEFWVLLSMGAHEAQQVANFRDMTDEERHLLTMALKEPGHYVEAVLLSEKYTPALLRLVPPALALALAQTEGEEKNRRSRLMRERGIGELDAALLVAADIERQRREHRREDQ